MQLSVAKKCADCWDQHTHKTGIMSGPLSKRWCLPVSIGIALFPIIYVYAKNVCAKQWLINNSVNQVYYDPIWYIDIMLAHLAVFQKS